MAFVVMYFIRFFKDKRKRKDLMSNNLSYAYLEEDAYFQAKEKLR